MKVTYISACMDNSGYAEAARNHIAALHQVGVTVEVKAISFEGFRSNLGKLGGLVGSLIHNKPNNRMQIIHTTPECYSQFLGHGKYNIGFCAWETSKLPEKWVPLINQLDEVWVPCEHNKKVFTESGITNGRSRPDNAV